MNKEEMFKRFFINRKKSWKFDLILLAIFVTILLVFILWSPALPEESQISEWVSGFGIFGPVVIIGIIIAETVIAPIPGTIVPIVIGALYGIWPGLLYAWIGSITGSVIAFWIARKFGRPIVGKFISEKKLTKVDNFLHRRSRMLYIAYIIPLLPLDVISFTVGLSKIKFRKFFTIITFGFTINLLILTFFGERIFSADGGERVLWAVITMIFLYGAVLVERASEE